MKTKIDEAEVEIVSVEIQFGVKMPIDVVVKKTTSYGSGSEYSVRALRDEFAKLVADDKYNIGEQVYAQAIGTVKKFEENEKKSEIERIRDHD